MKKRLALIISTSSVLILLVILLTSRGTRALTENNRADAQNVLKSVALAYRFRGASIQYNNKDMTFVNNETKVRRGECFFSPEKATGQDRKYLSCSPFMLSIYFEAFGSAVNDIFYTSNSNIFIAWANPDDSDHFKPKIAVYNVSMRKNGTVTYDKVFSEALKDSNYIVKYVKRTNNSTNYSSSDAKVYTGTDYETFTKNIADDIEGILQVGDIIGYRHANGESHVIMYIGTDNENKKMFIHAYYGDYYYENNISDDDDFSKRKRDKIIADGFTSIWDYATVKTKLFDGQNQISVIRPLNAIISNNDAKFTDNSLDRKATPNLVREMTSSVSKYESVNPNEKITYTITLENKKTQYFENKSYTNLSIKAVIPSNTTLESCDPDCEHTTTKVTWSVPTISVGAKQEFKYTVRVKPEAALGTEIINKNTEAAGITLNTIKTIVNKSLPKNKQDELVTFIKDKVNAGTRYSTSRSLIDAAYRSIGITGFNFASTTGNTVDANLVFNTFFEKIDNSDNYYIRSSFVDTGTNKFSKMYVKNLFGGYNVASKSYEKYNEEGTNITCNLCNDSRVKTFYNTTLMVGDVLFVYDDDYEKEIKMAAQATENKNNYIQISSAKNFYIYLGDGEFATVPVYEYSNGKVTAIDSSNLKAVIFASQYPTNSNYKRSRLLDSLIGQNAFIVLRPSYAYDGEIISDDDKPVISVVGETRTDWQNSQTFKIKLADKTSGLKKGTYNIKYMLYKSTDTAPTCNNINSKGTNVKVTVSENGIKEAITNITIDKNSGDYSENYNRLALCNSEDIFDINGNAISANTRSYGWKLYLDFLSPTIDIVSNSASTLLPSQIFKIKISDEGAGLKQGSTYTIKYAFGDENSNYTCSSSAMANNIITLSVPTSDDTVYTVTSNNITVDSGTSSRIYICNVESIKDNAGNEMRSNTILKELKVGIPKINFGLSSNASMGITDRGTYAKSQTFRFYIYADPNSLGFVGGNYKVKYKLYRASDAVPTCSDMEEELTITAADGQTGSVYSDLVTISTGNYDYIAYCNVNDIRDKTGNVDNIISANTLFTKYKMRIDNTNPKSALIDDTRSTWKKNQIFSFKLVDDGSGLKKGTYILKYKLYNDTVPACAEMTDEVSINVASDGIKEEYSDEIVISGGNYKNVAWCNSTKVLDVVGNSRATGSIYSHGYMYVDNTNPTISISSTNNLKATSQLATLKCSDANGIVSYYWGKSSPKTTTTYTTASADLTNGTGISKTINESGKYYLSCKDMAGNVTTKSIEYYSYTVDNKLLKTDGIVGNYNDDNYNTVSKNNYLAIAGTRLPLKSIYTISNYSNENTFVGASYGTGVDINTDDMEEIYYDDVTLDSDNAYYTMWFNRNVVNIEYNMNGGILSYHATNYTTDDDEYILRNGSRIIHKLNYGSSLAKSGLYNYNGSYFKITKERYMVKSPQWCLDPSGSGTCFNQDTVYSANNLCNYSGGDCTITLYVNWQEGEELTISFSDLNVDDEQRVINRLLPNIKASQLLAKVETNGVAKIIDEDGNEVEDSHIVTSKDKLMVTYNNQEIVYTINVLGDVNKDGKVNITDAYILARYIIDRDSQFNADILLGDINNDGQIKMNDVVRILEQKFN